MIITPKSAKLGVPIIIVTLLIFGLGFWALMLEPIQVSFINNKKQPPLIPFTLLSAVVGFLMGSLLYFGYSLSTLTDSDKQQAEIVKGDDLFRGKFWFVSIAISVAYIGLTLWWRSDLP